MQIVEDDSEEEEVKAPAAKQASPKAQAKVSPKAQSAPAAETKPAEGFRRMQIVEDDSEEEEEEQAQTRSSPSSQDPFPEVKVEASAAGVEDAKNQGNKLFASGD